MLSAYQKTAVLAVAAIGVWLIYSQHQKGSSVASITPGWEALLDCSDLTSIDSNQQLILMEDHTAQLSDNTKLGKSISVKGRWSLVNDAQHTYVLEIPGAGGLYTVVSPPDSQYCLFASGTIAEANLRRSWFSTDPNTEVDPPDN